MTAHGLTGKLGEIADAAGPAAALKLAAALGGHELKLSARPNGKLAKIVGAQAAAQIVEAMGAAKITVPMANLRGAGGRRAAAARMLASGAPISHVAQAADVHERTAFRVKAALGSATPMFPELEKGARLPERPSIKADQ